MSNNFTLAFIRFLVKVLVDNRLSRWHPFWSAKER